VGFSLDWMGAEYIEPDGGFEFDGQLAHEDIDFICETIRKTDGILVIEVKAGLFRGIFGSDSIDGWMGGTLKFGNREVLSNVVKNFSEIPESFLDPEEPYNTRVRTNGPHDLVKLMVEKNDRGLKLSRMK
jgi:hypothetical protein